MAKRRQRPMIESGAQVRDQVQATGFASERSELLDVKSGQRPDFSFDTATRVRTWIHFSLLKPSLLLAPNLERATGFEPATFSVEG